MSSDKKLINGFEHVRYRQEHLSETEMVLNTRRYYEKMNLRRSVRHFSEEKVPIEVIKNIIKTAGTAPSGAHKQPWKFCAVANEELKTKIRNAAEIEERTNYATRMSERWLEDLAPLGTDSNKDFLKTAPWLIIVFKEVFGMDENGEKETNYYVTESVGIACGMLISAIHNAGLVTLTHTPSPMNFLAEILERPRNERAFLLLPVGYPAEEVYVPNIFRKGLGEISDFYL